MAIVGGGPIGLELAAALRRAGVDHLVIEAGQIGATMSWWAPGTRFFSSPERIAIAGIPLHTPLQDKATREEYLRYLRTVADATDARVRRYTRVVRAACVDDGFALSLAPSRSGVGGPAELMVTAPVEPAETLRCKRLVLAIGDMHRPRMVGVPGEDLPIASHYLGEVHQYHGSRVVIVGGKNSAAEAAVRLHRLGAHVEMSYRRRMFEPGRIKYWLQPELEWLIDKGHIGWWPATVPTQITPSGIELEGVEAPVTAEVDAACEDPADQHASQVERGVQAPAEVDDRASRGEPRLAVGERTVVSADHVLLLTGYEQDGSLFDQLGVPLLGAERRPQFDHDTNQTPVPGVYVAGTACAGSQSRARVFIENSHAHVERIVASITGGNARITRPESFELEES